jgi:hypothetical protein
MTLLTEASHDPVQHMVLVQHIKTDQNRFLQKSFQLTIQNHTFIHPSRITYQDNKGS